MEMYIDDIIVKSKTSSRSGWYF